MELIGHWTPGGWTTPFMIIWIWKYKEQYYQILSPDKGFYIHFSIGDTYIDHQEYGYVDAHWVEARKFKDVKAWEWCINNPMEAFVWVQL